MAVMVVVTEVVIAAVVRKIIMEDVTAAVTVDVIAVVGRRITDVMAVATRDVDKRIMVATAAVTADARNRRVNFKIIFRIFALANKSRDHFPKHKNLYPGFQFNLNQK